MKKRYSTVVLLMCLISVGSLIAANTFGDSKMQALYLSFEKLRQEDLAQMTDLKDTWENDFKAALMSRDNERIIKTMQSALDVYPERIATCGAYMRLSTALMQEGKDERADEVIRQGIQAVVQLRKKYQSRVESLVLVAYCRDLYSSLLKWKEEDLEFEVNYYTALLEDPIYSEYQDVILYCLAETYYDRQDFGRSLEALEQLAAMDASLSKSDRGRSSHVLLRAKVLTALGKDKEAIEVLESEKRTEWGKKKDDIINMAIAEVEQKRGKPASMPASRLEATQPSGVGGCGTSCGSNIPASAPASQPADDACGCGGDAAAAPAATPAADSCCAPPTTPAVP